MFKFGVGLAVTLLSAEAVTLAPPTPIPSVSQFNPSFTTTDISGPANNMPVGNGELVANVWVDMVNNGSLALLLGRSDAFSGDVQPMKVGRIRVELSPNPFAQPTGPCAVGQPYVEHQGYIGDAGSFVDPKFVCSTAATCRAEAQAK